VKYIEYHICFEAIRYLRPKGQTAIKYPLHTEH